MAIASKAPTPVIIAYGTVPASPTDLDFSQSVRGCTARKASGAAQWDVDLGPGGGGVGTPNAPFFVVTGQWESGVGEPFVFQSRWSNGILNLICVNAAGQEIVNTTRGHFRVEMIPAPGST